MVTIRNEPHSYITVLRNETSMFRCSGMRLVCLGMRLIWLGMRLVCMWK